jgi:hypothetical protein
MFGTDTNQVFYQRWTGVRQRGCARYIARTTLKYSAIFLVITYGFDALMGKPFNPSVLFHLMNVSALMVLMLIIALVGWKVQQWRYDSLQSRLPKEKQ